MSDLVAHRLAKATFVPRPTLYDLEASDAETRTLARAWKSTPWVS